MQNQVHASVMVYVSSAVHPCTVKTCLSYYHLSTKWLDLVLVFSIIVIAIKKRCSFANMRVKNILLCAKVSL